MCPESSIHACLQNSEFRAIEEGIKRLISCKMARLQRRINPYLDITGIRGYYPLLNRNNYV